MKPYISHRDEDLLNQLGYAQELKREFSVFQLFSVAFSIMSLVPSIASVLSDGLMGGGIGMTWSWLCASVCILSVGSSLGSLGSSTPTSGSLYYLTYAFAPAKVKRPASFLCAYANTLGLIAGLCSINYGFANMLLSIPTVALDGSFTPTKYEAYGVLVAVTAVQGCLSLLRSSLLSRIQTFATWLNLVLVALLCIALPIGASHRNILNSGKFVFTNDTNLYSGWSYGGAFILSWMACIWTIGAFDSCMHMAEEASNAATAVPIGILLSVSLCGVLGFACQAIITACIKGGDFERIVTTSTGQPLAQIIYDCLGKKWTIALMVLMAFASLLMGSSMLTAASRQSYSTARDGVLPFSKWVKRVNPKTAVPGFAVLFDCVVCCMLGLLVLIDVTAANALFSLYSSSNALAWLLPIFFRLFFPGAANIPPGPYYLGKTLTRINDLISVVYLIFVVFVLTQLPQVKPVNKNTMNYTCVINPAVWLGALVYYFVDARKWFNGPVRTLDAIDGKAAITPEEPTPKLSSEKNDTYIDSNSADTV